MVSTIIVNNIIKVVFILNINLMYFKVNGFILFAESLISGKFSFNVLDILSITLFNFSSFFGRIFSLFSFNICLKFIFNSFIISSIKISSLPFSFNIYLALDEMYFAKMFNFCEFV